MRLLITFLFLTIAGLSANAQHLDSLWNAWEDKSLPDSSRVKAINDYIIDGYVYSDPDSALILVDFSVNFSKAMVEKKFLAQSLKIRGVIYYMISNSDKAIENYTEALEVTQQLGDLQFEASIVNNIGLAYWMKGDYTKALSYFSRSLKICVEIGPEAKSIEAATLANIAIIYFEQSDKDKGLEYYSKSLKIYEEIDNQQGLATALANLADTYRQYEDYDKSTEYSERSLRIYEELEDKYGIATALMGIGRAYRGQHKYEDAIRTFQRSLEIREEISDLQGVCSTLGSLSSVYDSLGQYDKSIELNQRALLIADSIGAKGNVQSEMSKLYLTYKKIGDFETALMMFEDSRDLRDSLFNEEKTKELLRTEYEFETHLSHIADSLATEQRVAISDAKEKRSRTQRIYLFIGLGLLALFSIFIVNRLIASNKQKKEIGTQKNIVEEQHKQIQSSIHYASRIQNALFSNQETWNRISDERFILFKPRDVVSGDFYWAHEKDNIAIWAAADCTGHGVPGAFMSMLGVSFLNDIVTEGGETRPDVILNELRDKIIKALEQKGIDAEQKDGMDIALCAWNKTTNEVKFSGAYNPLCLVTKNAEKAIRLSSAREISGGGSHLVVISGTKQPIGQHMKGNKPFELIEFQLEKGDTLYTFSDGYADQFGGPSGKKFMTKRFYELLLSMQTRAWTSHHDILNNTVEDWMKMSGSGQVDDICVVGVRI